MASSSVSFNRRTLLKSGGSSGAQVTTLAIRQSKSGASRHVILNGEGAAFFGQLSTGRSGRDIMLQRQGREWRSSEQAKPMRAACVRAKIADTTFHALRHSYASLAIMNGTPMLVVARNLGHADTRMVEKFYGHLTRDYEAAQIEAGTPKFGFVADPKIANLRP